ncbi:uncharacterized protein LOC127463772 isoform X2 [Manacus candei]|uniref:uncharacterized protein LOC127463772 isoform X2 n=1 Tax=Manacus candei TaxID=415023 RepID=UPI002226FF5C|nr:uncharacterized protein LOC127463772 isoform X2 [Manacus candei]
MGTRGIQDWDTPIPKVLRDGDRDTPIPGGSRTGIPPFPRSWGVSLKPLRGLGTGFQLCFLPNSHPDFPGLFSPLPALCNSRIYRFLFLLPNSPEIPDNPGLFSHLQVLWNSRLFRFIFLLPKNSRLSRLIFSPPSFLPDFPALFSSPFPSRLPRFIFSPPTSLAFPSFQLYFLPPKFWAIPDIPSQFFLLPNPHPEFPGLFSHLPLLWHSQLSRFIFLLPNILTDVPGLFSHLPVLWNSKLPRFIFSPPKFSAIPDFSGLFSYFPVLWNSRPSRLLFSPPSFLPDFPALFSSQFPSRLPRFIFSPPTSLEFQTSQVYILTSQFSRNSRHSRFIFSPPSFLSDFPCLFSSQFPSRLPRFTLSPPNSLEFQSFQLHFLPIFFPEFPGLFSHLPVLWNSRLFRFVFLLPSSPEIPDIPGLFSHLPIPCNSRLSRFIFSPPTSLAFPTFQIPSLLTEALEYPRIFPFIPSLSSPSNHSLLVFQVHYPGWKIHLFPSSCRKNPSCLRFSSPFLLFPALTGIFGILIR